MKVLPVVLIAFTFAVAACTDGATTTTAAAPPTATTTSLVIPERIEATTTVDPGAADPETTERVAGIVAELAMEAETIRGLRFVDPPSTLVLEPPAYQARLDGMFATAMSSASPTGKTAFYRATELLPAGTVEGFLSRVRAPESAVFYDPESFVIVASSSADKADPVMRAAAIHELILALTDQHHGTGETRAALVAAGADDRLRAFDALVEGDATYFQLVYIQSMAPEDRTAVAAAFAATDTPALAIIPDLILEHLAFAYDAGVTFVEELVATAGIAAVDQAYRRPPDASEQILHPERYRRGEATVGLPPLDVAIDGAAVTRSATFGEFQLGQFLALGIDAGMVTQTVDGWQGDQYQLVETDTGFAFALTLAMESDDDAIEVVGALIAHARDVLEAGEGVEVAGGLRWESDTHYVFIDRVGDGLVYVLATDGALGRAVLRQIAAP